MELVLSDASRITAGILLLTIVTIEFGGTFMLRVVGGGMPLTGFQKTFFRAGHAHAGVLVILGLVCQLLADATTLEGAWGTVARAGVPAGAILLPAGFFLSALGAERTQPNQLKVLLYLGAAAVAAGTLTLGIGLLTA